MKFNIKDILFAIIILLLLYFGYHYIRNNNIDSKYENEIKLNEALRDSVRYFKTELGEEVATKRSLVGTISELKKINNDTVIAFIKDIERLKKELKKKDMELFAAGRIEYIPLIESSNKVIANVDRIDSINNMVSFIETDSEAHFIYDLDVTGVRPYPVGIHPEITFNKIDFPNTQIVTFNFDKNKRKDYPISFSVVNTNPYYRVFNIESYTIEGLTKDNINPNGWKKAWNWIKMNGKLILVGAAGFFVGSSVSGN